MMDDATYGPADPMDLMQVIGCAPGPTGHGSRADAIRVNAASLAEQLWEQRRLHSVRFEELCPGLSLCSEPEPPYRLGLRARNFLMRNGFTTWAEFGANTPQGLVGIPNLGRKAFVEVVSTAIVAWAGPRRAATARSQTGEARETPDGAQAEDRPPLRTDPLVEFTREWASLLRWAWESAGAETVGDALAALRSPNVPAAVSVALGSLVERRLPSLLARPDVDETVWACALPLDPRSRAVVIARLLPRTGRPVTLDVLGQRYGVTRERIRQIEGSAEKRLEEVSTSEQAAPLRHLASRLRRVVGEIARPEVVSAEAGRLVALSSTAPTGDDELLRAGVLTRLAGPYVLAAGLLMTEEAHSCLEATESTIASSEPGSVLDESDIGALLAVAGPDPVVRRQLLEHLRLRPSVGRLLMWRGTHADRAVAVLAAHGDTLTMPELRERLGSGVNPRSLSNAIQRDPRIMRRAKDRYGLRTWGGEEYSGIVKALERAIDRSEGSIDLEDTIDRLVRDYGVSQASVRVFAGDRRFTKTPDGRLMLRGAEDPEPRA